MTVIADTNTILQFWFGTEGPDAIVSERQSALWRRKKPATDALIRLRFEATTHAAADHRLDDRADTPAGMLALILLLDQFPRNMYRGTPEAFAFDHLARQCCHLGLAQGFDQQLPLIHRVFFYLPLEHSEDLDDQELAIHLFRALARQAAAVDQPTRATFDGHLDFAQRHHAIIARFQRFPHRNLILGRASTDEEIAFLEEPSSSF